MTFENCFPIWEKLNDTEKEILSNSAQLVHYNEGQPILTGLECLGMILVQQGQVRAYCTSDEGREITLYRMFEHDLCILSASCLLPNIQFTIYMTAEKETDLWIIPPDVYEMMMEHSLTISNYSHQIMASRLSDVMWLMEQVMWKSVDKRLAAFLLEESSIEGSNTLKLTHEKIADHIGSAREVVTRMLRHFQSDGLVKLSRGTIELLDGKALYDLAD